MKVDIIIMVVFFSVMALAIFGIKSDLLRILLTFSLMFTCLFLLAIGV